jgi:hypothetical protein
MSLPEQTPSRALRARMFSESLGFCRLGRPTRSVARLYSDTLLARRLLWAGLWILSLVATSTISSVQAQPWTPLTEPTIVSGDDIGFRVEWMNNRVPTGKIVIRLNGQWVEARVGEPADRQVVPPPPSVPPPPR